MAEEKPFQRLPTNVTPVNYDIEITPNFGDFTFKGSQKIDLLITAETKEITMNAADLTVRNGVFLDNASGAKINARHVEFDTPLETVKFVFDPPLKSGSAGVLSMEFDGSINDKMKGFYRSKFQGPNGEDRYNGVTQFEATDARRCFPCWDEPSVKATFDIGLVVEKEKVTLSNMPVKATSPVSGSDNLHLVQFERTPIMSTYLVALVIGDFEYIETKSTDGVLCRVYTPPGKLEQGRFALDVVARVLPYYKEYFGIAYPLPKIDLVAIADFSAGAMENWGLVTYRETCLLIDEKQSSSSNRQWVALVVGHEAAHMWFGNLVTMEWWTHLWLNEGYATFVEFLCVDHLFPEYDIWTQFVTETFIRALELDCLENSHPIEVPVGHPSEIDEIFDDISYNKGACIIRMLHDYIGDTDFRKGMNLYLTRHQYKNAFTEDLWAALEEASGKPVGAVMGTWTKQMGFPLIRVLASRQEGTNRVIELSQEKFCTDPCKKTDGNYHWMIPLTFCSSSNPAKPIYSTLMDSQSMTVTIPNVSENEWVKLNPGTIGFYRVQYPPEILEQFLPAIQQKVLPPVDRLGLLDDVFALVQSGQTGTTNVLKLLDAFKDETNYTVWSSISNVMSKLNLLLQYTDYHDQFKAYGRKLFSSIEEKVGWEAKPDESHLDTMLRTLVLLRMTTFGHEKTIEEANKRLKQHVSGEKTIIADLRTVVYRGVLSVGDESTYNALLKLYHESNMQEEKDRIGRSLGAIKDPELLRKVLEFSISNDVRSQDSVFVIISVGMSKTGREIAWNFFKENKELFRERYPGGGLISRLVKYVTEDFVTEEMATEVEKFFIENSFPGTERTVQQSIESIRLNGSWLKRDENAVRQYLQTVGL
ncbi:Puromycin-sensitive aminopeptidase [Orchesella cincta]|uniref:Aminopeptidase n=1 Tax=Orchesella cincta TaxID=48709 RepID=A0A1D2N281_ORCCI|nr:Puromycin-sensitive aminopeptidase [Orchesella cincta]